MNLDMSIRGNICLLNLGKRRNRGAELRVLLVGDMLRYSGAEVSTLELLDALQRYGVESKLIVPVFRNQRIEHKNVVAFKVPFRCPSSSEDLYLELGNPVFQLFLTKFLIKQIRRFKPDILHSTQYFNTAATWLASKLTKIPFVSHVRDYRLVCAAETCFERGVINLCGDYQHFSCLFSATKSLSKALYGVLIVKIMRHIFSGSRKALVISDFVGRVMRRVLKKQVVVLYNIVSVNLQPGRRRHGNGFHILFYGRLSRSKGIGLLLSVIKSMNQDVVLHIAGKGELLETVLVHAEKMENVVYRGFLPSQDMYDLIRTVDLVVVPSLYPEPFGRTVVESQLIGVPVIASRRGGIPEILSTHHLFDPNASELRRKIEKVRKDPQRFKSQLNSKLDPERIVTKLSQIYRECIH